MENDCNDEDDALSLRDLQMYDHTATSSTRSTPRTSSSFEFFPALSNHTATGGDIIFCGKLIPNSVDHHSSFRLRDRPLENVIPLRSVSNPDLGHRGKFTTSVKKVNVTSTSTSKLKKRRFMFGPVKFMPEMDMRSIRERQGRLAPSRMFPVAEPEGGKAVAVTATVTVSCRVRLNSMFERSLACLRS